MWHPAAPWYRIGRSKIKTPRRAKPARVGDSKSVLPLAGGEFPRGESKRLPTLSAGPKAGQPPTGGKRKQPLASGPFASARDKRVAAPHPRRTRVRFEFARGAHQRQITPNVGINLAARSCQEESDDASKKMKGFRPSAVNAPRRRLISRRERAYGTAGDCGGGSRRDTGRDSF